MNGHSAHATIGLGELLLKAFEGKLSVQSKKGALVKQLVETSKPFEPEITEQFKDPESDDWSESDLDVDPNGSAWCIYDENINAIHAADPAVLMQCFEEAFSSNCLGEFIETLLYERCVPTAAIEILMPRFIELYADTKRDITLQPNADDMLWSRGMKEWASKAYKIMRLRYGEEW